MRYFVSDRPLLDVPFGVIAGMIIVATHASTGFAFLIVLVVGLVAAAIKFGPEQLGIRGKAYGSRPKLRRRRNRST